LVAYCKATGLNPEHRKVLMVAAEQSCESYLTTLLDSPEMVEKLAKAAREAVRDYAGGHSATNTKGDALWHTTGTFNLSAIAKAVIAAIKKEAGL
jgi:hypothetical protein